MLLLQFLVIFAIIVSMMYIMVSPENRKGLLVIAAVITGVFIYSMNKEGFSQDMGTLLPKDVAASSQKDDKKIQAEECDALQISDALTVYTLPQVDILGRNIDDKMAMNQTASRVVVPGGINAVFESRVSDDMSANLPEPSSGPLTGSPLF